MVKLNAEEESESEEEINLVETSEVSCTHQWKKNTGADNIACYICNWYPSRKLRAKCTECYKEACIKCLEENMIIEKEEVNLEEIRNQIEISEVRILRKRIENLEEMQKLIIRRIEILETNNKGKQVTIEPEEPDYLHHQTHEPFLVLSV